MCLKHTALSALGLSGDGGSGLSSGGGSLSGNEGQQSREGEDVQLHGEKWKGKLN